MDSRTNGYNDNEVKGNTELFLNHLSDYISAESFRHQESVPEDIRTDRRFTEMNRQINALSSLDKALTNYLSTKYQITESSIPNRREKNGRNALTSEPVTFSD